METILSAALAFLKRAGIAALSGLKNGHTVQRAAARTDKFRKESDVERQ
jgi:hypothetical protein